MELEQILGRRSVNRIQRHEEYINDNLLQGQFDRKTKNEVWGLPTQTEFFQHFSHP